MNKTMTSYQILKNGEPAGIVGTLDYIVSAIRNLESNLDRATEHSPYTIALVERSAKIKSGID
jgi:hypothetical protein